MMDFRRDILELGEEVVTTLAERNARIIALTADVTRLQKLLEVQAKVNRELSERLKSSDHLLDLVAGHFGYVIARDDTKSGDILLFDHSKCPTEGIGIRRMTDANKPETWLEINEPLL